MCRMRVSSLDGSEERRGVPRSAELETPRRALRSGRDRVRIKAWFKGFNFHRNQRNGSKLHSTLSIVRRFQALLIYHLANLQTNQLVGSRVYGPAINPYFTDPLIHRSGVHAECPYAYPAGRLIGDCAARKRLISLSACNLLRRARCDHLGSGRRLCQPAIMDKSERN